MLKNKKKEGMKQLKTYFGNAFSINMVRDFPCNIKINQIDESEYEFNLFKLQGAIVDKEVISVVGHEQLARILSIPMNRISVTLEKGDILWVAQYRGPRLEEGATSLPEGSKIELYKVEIS